MELYAHSDAHLVKTYDPCWLLILVDASRRPGNAGGAAAMPLLRPLLGRDSNQEYGIDTGKYTPTWNVWLPDADMQFESFRECWDVLAWRLRVT